MNVGSKLALLIFGTFAVVFFFIIVIMIYLYFNIGIELTILIAIFVPSFAAGIGGTTYIWGKLRESQRKSLETVNETALRSLWGTSNPSKDPYRVTAKDFENPRDYLKKYARFLGIIKLHPIKWKRIDRIIALLEPFEKNLKKIDELAQKEMGEWVDREKILYKLDFDLKFLPSMSAPDQEKEYTRVALKVQNEQRKLIDDTKKLTKDVNKIREEIHENLDNFLKENHLSLLTHWHTLQ